jgi:hypothetical protein
MTSLAIIGTCLDFAAEDHRVTEQNAALKKMSAGVETLWSDPRRRSAIVLLQDRAQWCLVDVGAYSSSIPGNGARKEAAGV